VSKKNNKKSKGNKLPYLFSEGLKGLYRNKVLSAASILVLSACIVVVGLFMILTHVIENNLSVADELYVVTAYISTKAEEEKITNAFEKVKSFDNVTEVSFVSKEKALEELKAEVGDLSDVVKEYENELSSYIRARFDIRFESYDMLNALVSELERVEVIETVNTKLDLYHGISNLKKAVTAISSALILLLFVVAVFVTLNTVRIGIYYRKDEISLMRYMGATKGFITAPYIIECLFMGAVSVLIAVFCEYFLYSFVLRDWIMDYGLGTLPLFKEFLPTILPAFFAVGVLSASFSGAICVKKYLSV